MQRREVLVDCIRGAMPRAAEAEERSGDGGGEAHGAVGALSAEAVVEEEARHRREASERRGAAHLKYQYSSDTRNPNSFACAGTA